MITTKIKTLKFDAGEKLIAFVEKKVARLEKFCEGKADEIIVTLENLKEGKSVKIQIPVSGSPMLIARTADTFENAVTACVDIMKENLTRNKEKGETM